MSDSIVTLTSSYNSSKNELKEEHKEDKRRIPSHKSDMKNVEFNYASLN